MIAGAGAIAVPFVLSWSIKRPEAAAFVLIAASAVPKIFIEIGGLKSRPEHIIGGLLIFVVPFVWKKREQPVLWIFPDYLLLAYVSLNFVSSAFLSVSPAQTVKWAVQQTLAILPYFWLRILIADRKKFRQAFEFLLWIGAATAGYAVICFYSYVFLGTALGVEVEQYGDVAATYGLQYEANLLGAFSGALSVMMLAMYVQENSRKYLIGFSFFALTAMIVSLSRGALGATFIGFLAVVWFSFKKKLLTRKVMLSAAAAGLAAVLLVAPFVIVHFVDRFSTVEISDPTADPNTLTRAIQTITAIDEVANHPIFGGGTSSFQLAFDWQSLGETLTTGWEDQGWIANTELRVLHDTGIVGLAAFSLFVVSLAWQARGVLKKQNFPELAALLTGSLVYCVSFQATEGTLLAFVWVQLGLVGCAISLMKRAEQDQFPENSSPPLNG